MLEQALQRWASLSIRERRIVLAGGLILLAAILWALAYEPAARGRERLLLERTSWQADLARMESLTGQARQLGAAAAGEPQSLQVLRERLEQSLVADGLGSPLHSIKVGPDQIEIRLKAVSAQRALLWIDNALRETRLRVSSLSLDREGPPAPAGTVSIRMTLDRPGRGT